MMINFETIQAKSDQMNAVDFSKSIVFKVTKVDYNPRSDQPIAIHMEGYEGRPFKPCKSMLRGLTRTDVWGMDETTWGGKLIELYCDTSVKWAGKEAGGIRISGVSGVSSAVQFPVQLNRSQRTIHTFRKLDESQETKQEFIVTHWTSDISEAKSNAEIDAIVQQVKNQFGKEALLEIKESVIEARKAFTSE